MSGLLKWDMLKIDESTLQTIKNLDYRKDMRKRKKLSSKQKKIARVAKPRNRITGADFKKLRRRKKRR